MHIYIQTIDKEWRPGSIMLPLDRRKHLGRFAHFMADVMAEELSKAIDNQRYAKNWAPLSISYYNHKKVNNLSLNIWEATGLLKDSISVWRSNHRWVVGIPRHKRYPGTFVRVHTVAKYLEYGTSRMPARPLFRPLSIYLSKNVERYWTKFVDQEGIQ